MKNKIMDAVYKASAKKNLNISMQVKNVPKVNQKLTGLILRPVGGNVGCTVYLENYIAELSNGTPLEKVAEDILEQYSTYMEENPDLDNRDYYSKEYIKNNVSVQLINAEMNADYLTSIAHTKFLDLACIYRVNVNMKGENASYVITSEHLAAFGIEVQELDEWARRNDAETANYTGASLVETMLDMAPELEVYEPSMTENKETLWVFTNESKLFGASVLLHPETFSFLAEKWNRDLYLFPSSTHDIIAIAYDSECLEDWRRMVAEINSSDAVEVQDFLSNNVYVYRRSSGTVAIAGKEPEDEI